MTKFLIGAVVAAAAAIGSAGVAQASPTSAVNLPVHAHGRGSVGIGIGFGGGGYYGGGYYGRGYARPVQSGYWTTQYRQVPTTVFVGYDQWQRPVYQTQYVQQAYQVWVPATYAPVVYARPSVHVGVGYRWR